jgi:hypothetical protein
VGTRGAVAILAVSALFANEARAAPNAKTCAEAAEHGQTLRRQGTLLAARDQFLLCSSNDSCPNVVRSDCAQWAAEVLAATPTIVVDVRDENDHDVFDAKIFVDDKLASNKVDGRAVAVDPGYHTVRVEPAQGPVTSATLIAKENVKARAVVVRIGSSTEETPPPQAKEPSRGWPWHRTVGIAAIVIGVAAVAYGLANYFSYNEKKDRYESEFQDLSKQAAQQAATKLGIPPNSVDQKTMCTSVPPAAQAKTCDQRAEALDAFNDNEKNGTDKLPLWVGAAAGGVLFIATGVVFLVGGRRLFDKSSAIHFSPTLGGGALEGTF